MVFMEGVALLLVSMLVVPVLVEGWACMVLLLFIEPLLLFIEPVAPLVLPWFWLIGPCADDPPGVLVTWGADVCA
ncbi:hypothetical protein GCM10011496_03890 [Polaromonas eurypsychrophila]|uniref:Uncharacterized protein n=1 Tax=Polaromonas eurypsychrophila TaxID=1614635 RepID=A0A916S680_9BURK|nr:hypothetical protein GCM10011496_03890 [Polaromonas eurypsychrophila]